MRFGIGVKSLVFAILLPTGFTSSGQRFFSIESDSLTRSYLLVTPLGGNVTNLPLVILLHDKHVLPTTLANMKWSKLRQPPLIVFPVGLRNQWACGDNADSLKMDTDFLLKIIFEIQNNFLTDPSRVFFVGMGSSFCLADYFAKKHSALVRAAVRWNYTNNSLPPVLLTEPTRQLDSVVVRNPLVSHHAMPPERFAFEPPQERYTPYLDHSTLNFHIARWQQSSASRTEFDSVTMTDLSQYHFMFGFQYAYHFTERLSAHVETDFMIIPKEREINGISWGGGQGVKVTARGNGGIIVPYGVGMRYSIPREKFRPFLSGSIGGTFMFVGGGTAIGGTGGINKMINKRKKNVLRYSFGPGFYWRIAKAVSLQVLVQYTSSSNMEPAIASVKRFEGLSFQSGLLFLLGKQE